MSGGSEDERTDQDELKQEIRLVGEKVEKVFGDDGENLGKI